MFYALAALIGAIFGYAFRGLISKEKNALGSATKGAVNSATNAVNSAANKL